MDLSQPGLPIGLVVLVLVVAPCVLAVLFGLVSFRHLTPLIFHCRRCGEHFRRRPWKRFPVRCGRCRSHAWNDTQ